MPFPLRPFSVAPAFSASEAARLLAEKELAEFSLDELHAWSRSSRPNGWEATKPVEAAGVAPVSEEARISGLMRSGIRD